MHPAIKVTAISLLLAITVLHGTVLGAGNAQRSLVGVWRYAGEVDTLEDGSPAPTAALSDTDGLLVYTADGFMSVTLMPKARKWSTETATIAELRETVGNGTAYAGRYEVDEAARTVTHIPSVSMEPGYESGRLVRTFALKDDKLELSGTFPYEGKTVRFVITWVRVGK